MATDNSLGEIKMARNFVSKLARLVPMPGGSFNLQKAVLLMSTRATDLGTGGDRRLAPTSRGRLRYLGIWVICLALGCLPVWT